MKAQDPIGIVLVAWRRMYNGFFFGTTFEMTTSGYRWKLHPIISNPIFVMEHTGSDRRTVLGPNFFRDDTPTELSQELCSIQTILILRSFLVILSPLTDEYAGATRKKRNPGVGIPQTDKSSTMLPQNF